MISDILDEIDARRYLNAHKFTALDRVPSHIVTSHEDKESYGKMYDFMMNHYQPWYENLTPEERTMASWNRPIDVTHMNSYLRAVHSKLYDTKNEDIEKGINIFDSMIDKSPPTPHDIIFYRGTPESRQHFGGSLEKGHQFTLNHFQSMSLDPYTAGAFSGSGSMVMRVLIPKGTRAAPVTAVQLDSMRKGGWGRDRYINYPRNHEAEFVLPRDNHFRIASSPHVENFRYSDKSGDTAPMKVADFVMSPHPSPEEAPSLPHKPILSSDTKVIKHQLTPEEWTVTRPRG